MNQGTDSSAEKGPLRALGRRGEPGKGLRAAGSRAISQAHGSPEKAGDTAADEARRGGAVRATEGSRRRVFTHFPSQRVTRPSEFSRRLPVAQTASEADARRPGTIRPRAPLSRRFLTDRAGGRPQDSALRGHSRRGHPRQCSGRPRRKTVRTAPRAPAAPPGPAAELRPRQGTEAGAAAPPQGSSAGCGHAPRDTSAALWISPDRRFPTASGRDPSRLGRVCLQEPRHAKQRVPGRPDSVGNSPPLRRLPGPGTNAAA